MEDTILLILGEKPRHTAVCMRFSPASQKNFLSYKTALHLKTSCFYVRMCPKREAIPRRIASFEGALWREKSRFPGDLSLSRVSLFYITTKCAAFQSFAGPIPPDSFGKNTGKSKNPEGPPERRRPFARGRRFPLPPQMERKDAQRPPAASQIRAQNRQKARAAGTPGPGEEAFLFQPARKIAGSPRQ